MVALEGTRHRILVTGASGFVGRALCTMLQQTGRHCVAALRATAPDITVEQQLVGNIGPDTDWRPALKDVDCVLHLAARTHVLDDRSADPFTQYRRINVQGTIQLAQQAATAGVRRLVFLSSVKVNGEATASKPYTEDDAPMPQDAYGITKHEAEQALHRIGGETGIEIVILRPPLVYGAGVKGNFLRLLHLISRGVPLPLASVRNQRSMIFVNNLVDAIVTCMDAPAAAGKTYLVSDGVDVSTPELISKLAAGMNRPPRLLPCPIPLLHAGAAVLGKSAVIARLTGSLTMDSTRVRHELGWQPRYSLDQGLNATAQWYYRGQIEGVS